MRVDDSGSSTNQVQRQSEPEKPQPVQPQDKPDKAQGTQPNQVQADQQKDVFEPGKDGAQPAAADKASKIPADVQKKLGLTDDDVKAVADAAVPDLKKAADAIGSGDTAGAIENLKNAAAHGAKELAERLIVHQADKLPDYGAAGVAKRVLTDPKAVHELLNNPDSMDAVGKLAKGDLGGAIQSLSKVPAVRDNLISQVAKDPTVAAGLQKLGLESQDLVKAGTALPDLIDAGLKASAGDSQGALASLGKVVQDPNAREVMTQAINTLAKNLPDGGAGGMAKSLLSDKDFVDKMLQSGAAADAMGQLAKGQPFQAVQSLAGDTELMQKAAGALSKNADFNKGLSALGLTADAVQKGAAALPEVLNAVDAASKGDTQKAIGYLADAAQKAPQAGAEMINAAAKKLPDGPAKALLTDPKFVQELLKDKDTAKAVKAFAAGDVEGGLKELAKTPAAFKAGVDALYKDPSFKSAMDKLGVTPDALKGASDALPSIAAAGIALAKGDTQTALSKLGDAAQKAPELAAELINKAAANLPDGPAKALLTDKAFVSKLAADPSTAQAIQQLAKGDVSGGLKTLAGNEDAAKAAVDALAKDPGIKAGMDKLGLTPDALKKGVDALPELIDAAAAAGKGDLQGAIGKLADAAQKAPEVTAELVNKAAQNLPDGPAKALLTDPKFVKALFADKDTAKAIKQLAAGDLEGGLKSLAKNPDAAKAAVDALYKDPGIKAGMDKLGLTPDALKQGVDALPDLVSAGLSASKGDLQGAVGHLADAAGKAPEVVAQAINKAAANLPAGPAKALLSDPNFVQQLAKDPNTAQAIKDLAAGKVTDAIRGLSQESGVAQAAVDALMKDPSFSGAMQKLGISADDLKAGTKALPALVDAATAVAKGDFQGAIQSLVKAAESAPELVSSAISKAAENLPSTGPAGVLRSVLTDKAAVQAMLTDSSARDAVGRLAKGDLEGLRDLAGTKAFGAVVDALAKNPEVAKGLEKLGLTADDVKGAARALPDLIGAAQKFAQGDVQGAFTKLRDAAVNMPPAIIEKAIIKGASQLPDKGPASIAKSLFTDPAFVHQVVTNPALKDAFNQAMSGDLTKGVQNILTNPQFADAAANALSKNSELMKKLAPFGITTANDLKQSGAALTDLLQAGEAIAKGDVGKALSELGEGFLHLPDGVKANLIGKLADALHLPPAAKDILTGVVGALGDPKVRSSLGNAFQALKNGDLGGFVSGIADAGRQLTTNDPQAATALLNSLGKLPGSIGKLFQDRDFNKSLVDSGAATEVFNAVEKMGKGDIGGALQDIAQAAGKLLTQEPHFEIAGQKLPIGMKGLENMARLFGRFIDALPDSLKTKIMEAAGKAAAGSVLKSIPIIGNVASGISAIGSAKSLIDDLGKEPKDWVNVALDAAQTGLDIAGTIPGIGNIASTLGNIVGVGKVIKGASDLITDVKSFQSAFVGI